MPASWEFDIHWGCGFVDVDPFWGAVDEPGWGVLPEGASSDLVSGVTGFVAVSVTVPSEDSLGAVTFSACFESGCPLLPGPGAGSEKDGGIDEGFDE